MSYALLCRFIQPIWILTSSQTDTINHVHFSDKNILLSDLFWNFWFFTENNIIIPFLLYPQLWFEGKKTQKLIYFCKYFLWWVYWRANTLIFLSIDVYDVTIIINNGHKTRLCFIILNDLTFSNVNKSWRLWTSGWYLIKSF